MADLSDVADAIVTIATQAVYPNGAGRASIVGQPIALYQGWPSPQSLDQDMPVGKAHVTVFPRPGDTVTSTVMGDGEWIELSNDGAKGTAGIRHAGVANADGEPGRPEPERPHAPADHPEGYRGKAWLDSRVQPPADPQLALNPLTIESVKAASSRNAAFMFAR